MGQYEKAIDPLKKSIAIRPSYPGYVNLGVAYAGLEQARRGRPRFMKKPLNWNHNNT